MTQSGDDKDRHSKIMSIMLKLSLEQRKKLQLDMLTELDTFCKEHNLKYVLAYGTLLGAVRHSGYIPWDDDVDIIMSYNDVLYLKEHLKSELMSVIDVKNCDYHYYAFPRLVHNGSFSIVGKNAVSHGVCIDLYVMIPFTEQKSKQIEIVNSLMPYYRLRNFFMRVQGFLMRKSKIKYFPLTVYLNRLFEAKYYKKMIDTAGKKYYIVSGPLNEFEKEIFDINILDITQVAKFENRELNIPADYDNILKQWYGNYMQLPPEDQRHPYHGGDYYLK